ncbi:hypothetical protein DXG03_002639 [Asterophora parasitica]|uniref:Fe2OG dioxygenase domain-containing protein n=1 Tax=Asterophora parasitica TaxID=117018 RepID=A0A9P7KEP6_9AGAR|nr:hypothetical protein DXG03_002639 [Asterophora parasitica]
MATDGLKFMASALHDPSSHAYKKAHRLYLKATKHRNPDLELDWSPFRAAEKKYKARFPPPDLSDILDLATVDPSREEELRQGGWRGSSTAVEYTEILGEGRPTKVYTVPRIPGLVILPSFVSHEKQRELVQWSLCDHARHPNETNLDIHYLLPQEGIWNTWLSSRDDPSKDEIVRPRATEPSPPIEKPGPRQLVNNTPATPVNFSKISATPKPPQSPSTTVKPVPCSELVSKLRWANIGWYYHWGTKQYDFTKGKGFIDPRPRNLCRDAVAAVNWEMVYADADSDWGDGEPEPDAGIVNFYQTKDTLMAHVDRSEVCATSPLVSISLGNAAVFLIGGNTRDSEPVPILLRSGDVVIMSGPNCRRAYHGVPRILEGTLPPHLESRDPKWKPYEAYMRSTRININVRQVFPKGFEPEIVIQ